MWGFMKSFFFCYPELEKHKKDIHFIFASTHTDFAFIRRDTTELLMEARQAIREGKKIIFFNSSETFIPELMFKAQRIAELLPEIPKSHLFFSVGVPNGQTFYDELCVKYKWENRFNILSSHWFEQTIADHFRHSISWGLDTYEYQIKPKDKLFLCFNKLHRKHRLQLLAEAIRNNWLDKSYYSFEGAFPNWYDRLEMLPIHGDDLKTVLSIKDRYPLRLNITEDRPNPVDLDKGDLTYHENSYFSIVTETIMGPMDYEDRLLNYMNTLFLSEKIYKPFAFKHPFIAFAWPGALKVLRERGYKTFHPYIDESYDDEPDYEKRFAMLIKEIKRLEQFTTEQWIEWQTNIKPIVDHNAKYLLSLTDHRWGDPVDHFFRKDPL